MLRLELKINREQIGHVNAVRKEIAEEGKYVYDIEAKGYGHENYNFNFKVKHNPDEGPEKLVLEIYREIDKMKRKMK